MKIEHVMDQSSLKGGGSEIDLESGCTTNKGNECKKLNLTGASSNTQLHNVGSECIGGQLSYASEKSGPSFSSLGKGSIFDESVIKNEGKLPSELNKQKAYLAEKKMAHELPKKPESMRSSKPPRPPRGPSLDAADMMLVKEISRLAILKRKRIERMKTLQRLKKEKASSRTSSLFAIVVTVIFFIVIFVQGNAFFGI